MSSAEWNATLRELTVALDASGQQQIPIPTYRASHPPRTAKQPDTNTRRHQKAHADPHRCGWANTPAMCL
jgi:hypothetical protein